MLVKKTYCKILLTVVNYKQSANINNIINNINSFSKELLTTAIKFASDQ